MTPQFLRSEAARFRELAELTDREASRQRLLGMAVDYEARAQAAGDQPTDPQPVKEELTPATGPEPEGEEAVTVRPGRRRLSLRG